MVVDQIHGVQQTKEIKKKLKKKREEKRIKGKGKRTSGLDGK